MRLPRHDTPLSLPACGIAEDEALLDRIQPGDAPLEHWWIASQPAVALGLGLHHRLESIVDIERCRAFIARCRNDDGGYGVAPGQASQVSATYYAAIILHWLDEK